MNARKHSALLLSILLSLFVLRVFGQLAVSIGLGTSILPPFSAWQSGLLPYSVLLILQFFIIALFAKIIADIRTGTGFFGIANETLGKRLTIFGVLYFASMIIRYTVQMELFPELRWFGGTIPIVFHIVLATFVMIVGNYHKSAFSNEDDGNKSVSVSSM